MANKALGEKLKTLRAKNGLTQKAVYEQLGISQSTFSSWEIGKSEPDALTFLRLCRIYKVEDILFEFTGESLESKGDPCYEMFLRLDVEDKAEIKGEMKQMLKAEKYKTSTPSISDTIADDIRKIQSLRIPTH